LSGAASSSLQGLVLMVNVIDYSGFTNFSGRENEAVKRPVPPDTFYARYFSLLAD